MHASLDRIDVVTSEQDIEVAVQGDTRDAHEIALTGDLAVVFAAARVINPLRTGYARVRYIFMRPPPPGLAELVATAGAEVEVVGGQCLPSMRDDACIDATVAAALRSNGAGVLELYGVEDSRAGIEALEWLIRPDDISLTPEDGAEVYWATVLDLGAAVGEVLIRQHGYEWIRDPAFSSPVPWVLAQGEQRCNVFPRVMRYLERGVGDAPSGLIALAESDPLGPGQTLMSLRASTWSGLGSVWSRPLLDMGEVTTDALIPHVTLVVDRPQSIATFSPEDDAEQSTHEAEALANLAEIEVEVEMVEGDFCVAVVHGHEYATEKVLDPSFMGTMHARLESEILLVGMPLKGVLFVSPLGSSAANTIGFAHYIAAFYRDAGPKERLTTTIFAYADGAVSGVVGLGSDEPPSDSPSA